ncbi:GD15151 [Drosophila simulans]|uniref:GD15151 n=1 Tax=Drosophila simulans TaxID=7240 RepID=B4NTA3_DROSI|nr:GD15151 [Drosophila simulans]
MVFAGAQKFAYRMRGDEQQQRRQQENRKQEEGSQAYTCAEAQIHVSANYTVSCPMWLTLSEAECCLCTRRTLLLLRISTGLGAAAIGHRQLLPNG